MMVFLLLLISICLNPSLLLTNLFHFNFEAGFSSNSNGVRSSFFFKSLMCTNSSYISFTELYPVADFQIEKLI